MYKKNLFKKRLVVEITFLFIGMSVIPSNGKIGRYSESLEINKENDYESCIDFIMKFYPTDDAYLSHRGPDGNSGSSEKLQIRNEYGYDGSTGWAWDTLIKFDVSSIPYGTNILYAKLKLYYYDTWDSNPGGRNLRLYRATNDWDKNTVSWNTQPYYASQSTSYATIPSSPGFWMTWDVTSDIQDFIDGSKTNYGWKITDDNYWGQANIPVMCFYSKEYGSNIPYLDIVYYGNWLYVGGSGEGNYTHIQDAIDNASNGDTLFVYDDSSPYYENIFISKSINLIGENKDTTIINGGEIGDIISVTTDNVTIRGFTIQNSSYGSAIFLFSNNCKITDNILSHNNIGIIQYNDNLFDSASLSNGCNTISNNLIIYNEALGIGLCGTNNNVYGNIITQNYYGIGLVFAVANNISNNLISENEYGISIEESYNNVIYRNNISKNEKLGISIFCTSSDKILQNNFIGNGKNAYFNQPIIIMFRVFKRFLNLPIKKSIWDGNFWDRSRMMPYMVPGLISLIGGPFMNDLYIFNNFQFDWHPAQKPYNIF